MGSFVVGVDATVVNVALPAIEEDLGGGLAGQQWVVNAYLLFLASLILVGGSLGDLYGEQRIFRIGVAGFGVGLGAVRDRAHHRGARGGPGPAGRLRGTADAGGAGDHRRDLPAGRAGHGDRVVDGVERHRDRRRAARRRPARGLGVLAGDLRDQRALRADHAGDVDEDPGGAGAPPRRSRRRRGGDARGARPGRPDVRPDPAAGARLGRPDGVAPRPRRPRPARRLRRLGAPPQGPHAAAGHVPRAQLQRRQRRDLRHVRRDWASSSSCW